MLPPQQDIGRVTLLVIFIGGLLISSFWILQPFLPAILWATTLVLATWPLMRWVQRHSGNRRGIAVFVMTMAILLLVIVPLWLAVGTVVAHIDVIGDLGRAVLSIRMPPPPDWLRQLPLIGDRAVEAWERIRQSGLTALAPKLLPYAGSLTQWIASAAGSVGGMFIQFLLTTVIAAVMYAGGEHAASKVLRFGRRLAGDRGERAVLLAGQAVRSVALGVVVTALAQSVIGGIGLRLVGVPYAALLTALMFVLCLIQLGPGFVLVPTVVWLYYSGDATWGTVLLGFAAVAMTIDQFIRPILIRKGADLPLLLILAGVIGGLIAFGVLGIFIGPTVLAVAYTLTNAWIAEIDGPPLQSS
ncbi:AI-2E family transporter YdiK [Mesorhizobium sp. LHD-90]|uniref:AI-2E family transporter YdiK n=1 Tax=Mesorhizobium sp. LHD-90 TaxID=3071414 RepID=UPI0027E137E6|nr:AI-2E family transporter YdiK [Mesorhizobium sp. LHD-90]MDQ6437558.1 AI-2E family transporter YdiK [Mesorhizobium sp. LHD-90]